jgi:hypothetical protein
MAVTPTPKKRLLLPDNSFLELPDVVTEEDKYRISLDLAQRFPDEYGSLLDPYQTFAGGAAEFFKGIPRGFASSLVGAAQGAVGLVTPGVDTEFESNLAAAQKYLEDESVLAPEEPYKDFFATKLGAGLGSVATYAMPGGIAKALGASATGVAARSAGLGMAVTGGAGEQAQRIQQERELGNDITTGSEAAALLGGAGVGATEMIPINRLFSKVTPETGSALLNIFSRMDKRSPLAGSVSDDIIRLTKGAASQGFAEGLQEGLAGMAQNVVSNVAYDADIEVGDSFLDDLMVGGGVGAIADVIVDAMGGRRTVANKIYRDKEEQLRKQRIERYNAEQAEELRKQRMDEMVKRGQPPEGVLMLPPPAATPSATPTIDGVYTVSPAGNPDRFTRATVFTSPDGRGGLSTMVYSPESEGYFDITEELQRGRSVEDAVAMAVAGDFGFTRDLPALGSAAIKQSFSVAKDATIPSIDPNRIQAELEGGRFSAPNEDSFIKVQPLPNGSFGLVDVTTGMPVDGGMYSTVNDAFASLRQINDQNAAISAANVLNYTGLIKNNPAYRLAASLRSPKNRLIQKSVVAAYLPKDKRKDLKDFYSPEEAKKLLGPKDFDEMMQGFGQITETNDLLRKYVADPVGINPNKRTITSSALTKLGKDKNLKIDIKDKAFKDYAKYWTGAENWADMSNGQRLYLMTRIANNPAMPEMIKFPNLFQRQYRRPQFEAVLGKLGQAQKDGKTAAISVSDIQKETGLSAPAAKQMFSDLIFSGRVKPVAPGKIQLIRSEQDYQADKTAKADGLIQNETVEQTASRLRGAGFTDESVKQVEKQVQQQTVEPKSPTPAVKAEIDARETAAVAQGANPQKERTASNFDKIIADALNRYGIAKFVKHQLETDAAKTRKLPNGQIVMRVGYFSPLKKMITVNVGDQINDPNISIEEIVRRISGTVDHEVIHAMREADMFTEKEWNTLSNFVRTAKIDKAFLDQAGDKSLMAVGGKGKQITTMLDEVRIRYAGKNLNEMQLVEEAVAESFRLWRQHGGKFAAGKPASLFQRILNFITSFATAWKGSGATSADQIFSAISDGEIGQRTPGLSVFNPSADATIRTLNFADQELSKVKKTIRKGDVARGPVKFNPESFDKSADKAGEELAGYFIDARGVAGLKKERINSLLNEYGYTYPISKAKAYLTYLTPDQFINATTPESYRKYIKQESRPLNAQELAEQRQPIFLKMRRTPFNPDGTPEISKPNSKTLVGSVVWEISGHEGRHRMQALKDAGIKEVPVVIQLSEDGRDFRSKPDNAIDITSNTVFIQGQDFSSATETSRGDDFLISNVMTPISYSNAKALEQRFVNSELDVSFMEMPLSEADNKRVDDYLESHVGNTPKGYIPKVNPNAPRAAIAAAVKFEQDGKEEPFPDVGRQFMLNEIAEEPIENDVIADYVRRYGKIKPEEMTFGQKAIFILESWKEGGFKSAFDDFSRVFRKAVIDRYNEFRRQEAELIGTENEGMLLAETSASAALGQLDRARGWLASAFNYGGVKWVRGANIVTADPSAFENDKLAGYIDVDESTPGLLNILGPLVNGSVPNGMGQFKTYSTLKRVQGFRNRAKQAQFELSNMPKETQDAATEARRAALRDIIMAANNVRLVDNPSDAQISQLIEEIDTNFPQVTEAYNGYQNWNKTLIQFGRDTGILTEELAERWKQWGDYFPFYQEMEEAVMRDQGFRSKSSMTKVDFFTKALSENAKDLEDADPFEMISKNAFGIIQAGLKNVAAGRILRNSEIVGEARKITGANPAKQASQLRKRGSYIKTVYEDGIEVYYEIADPLLHESMMNYGDPTLNTMTKILAMPANVLREMVTRDPGFVMANMLRDTLSSFVTSGTGYVPVIDTFKQFGMGEIDTLLKTGIVGGYDMSADPQDLKQYIKKQYRKQGIDMRNHAITSTNAVTRVWDWLGDMSTRSDAATRMAVYNAVLKRTGSEAAARQAAIEVLNFSRRGGNPIWKVVTASVPFLNARIQGLDVIYRSLGGKYSPYEGLEDRAVTQKRALMRGAMLAATTGVYFMLMQDNEEYKKTRREVRDDNWLIPAPVLGDKVMLKIPIPFEIGMLFKAVPETFLNFMFGDMDARGFRDSLVRQVNNSTNIDVTGFQIVKPLVDVWRNKDSFTGKEIVPYWVDKGTEAAEQYDERTTEVSKFLGKALNISPMKLDYLVGGYGGSLGLSLFLTTDKIIREASGDKTAGTRADYTDVNNLPVVRRFFYNAGTAGSRQQQEFYELRDEVDKTVATLNKIQKRGDIAEYYAYANTRRGLLEIKSEVLAVERYLKRYRQTREDIIRSDLPADVKRDYLEQLDADRDMRMTIVPVMRERGDIPSRAASAIADAFIG